jgi:uncharacterized protein YkwD
MVMPPRPDGPRPSTRWLTALALLALLATAVFAPTSSAQRTAPAAPAATARAFVASTPSPDIEAQFVSRINGLRASKGLSQLRVDGELLGVARNWTERMVQAGQISHNPNLGSQVSGNWTKLGENVGVGPDVDGLMQAFINSPAHYRNLVDPDWNYVAVGAVVAADGQIYTTHNFMAKPDGSPPPTTPPPPPPSRPSTPTTRPPASTPTTAPPATTPTTAAPPPPPTPHPSAARVTAVLDPLRTLERG